jgi:hypothetical protein
MVHKIEREESPLSEFMDDSSRFFETEGLREVSVTISGDSTLKLPFGSVYFPISGWRALSITYVSCETGIKWRQKRFGGTRFNTVIATIYHIGYCTRFNIP